MPTPRNNSYSDVSPELARLRLACAIVIALHDTMFGMACAPVYKLVLIEWLDSRRGAGWVRLDELEASVARCKSAGWIITEDSDSLTMAGHMGDDPVQCLGDITIPKCAILNITDLSVSTPNQVISAQAS